MPPPKFGDAQAPATAGRPRRGASAEPSQAAAPIVFSAMTPAAEPGTAARPRRGAAAEAGPDAAPFGFPGMTPAAGLSTAARPRRGAAAEAGPAAPFGFPVMTPAGVLRPRGVGATPAVLGTVARVARAGEEFVQYAFSANGAHRPYRRKTGDSRNCHLSCNLVSERVAQRCKTRDPCQKTPAPLIAGKMICSNLVLVK